MVSKFPGKVPENPEIVEFPKNEPFNLKFRKFRDGSQMERKFPGKKKKCSKIWVYLTRLSEFGQIRNFRFSASCFGHDHSELDISRNDNGDAFSKMD